MNAYKCDICKSFFEDKRQDIRVLNPRKIRGHNTLQLLFDPEAGGPGISIFKGDICLDCYGLLCEQMIARGCTDEYVALDAEVHRTEAGEALKTDASIMEYFRMYYTGKPIGYFDNLIEYLSQFDENDAVKVKYIRQKIEAAIGESVDWYERRK